MLLDGSIKEHNVDGHVYIKIKTGLPPTKCFIWSHRARLSHIPSYCCGAMILHARFEGVHAALIHSPCLTRSLILDERLTQSSPCIIIITFSFTLYRCLFFHKFSSLSRSDHVENNSFHAWCMKLSFHQVFIHPQRTPIEWVVPVLLRRCNLSKAYFRLHIAQCFCHISLYGSSNSSILDALELALDRASDF
jgi:hypothetical protein